MRSDIPGMAVAPPGERLRAELVTLLLASPRCRAEGPRCVTEVLGFLRYVIDARTRSAHTEVRGRDGSWTAPHHPWDLTAPLTTWHWLVPFFDANPDLLADEYGQPPDNDMRRSLMARIRREIQASRLMGPLREAIVRSIPLDPEVRHIAEALAASGVGATSDDYTEAWRSKVEWSRLVAENAGLAMLLRGVQRNDSVGPRPSAANGFAWLKAYFQDLGVGRAGWQFLCRHAGVLLDGLQIPQKDLDMTVATLAWLLRGFRGELPRLEVIGGIVDSLHLVDVATDLDLPHRLIELADVECRRAHDPGHVWRFIEDEWMPTIAWFVEANPRIHRNQWAGGWDCIRRAKNAYMLRELAGACMPEWKTLPVPFTFPGFVALELSSYPGLREEGIEMAHCVADFVDDCRKAKTRVFSLRDEDGRRVATIALSWCGEQWEPWQVKGRANTQVPDNIRQIADELAIMLPSP